jgi:O-antigen/teichoic acid export membrane protein
MGRFYKRVWALLLYFMIPAAGALSPLLVIPAVSYSYGPSGWAVMAIGQSIGGAAAVIGELGWGVVGPQQVARLSERERAGLYHASLASRLMASLPLVVVAAVLAAWVAADGRTEAALLAAGTALSSLNAAWFFTGMNRPLLILGTESLPKILTALISGVLIAFGYTMAVFGILTILQVALTLYLAGRFIDGRALPRMAEFRGAPATIRRQFIVSVGRSVSVVYTFLPTAIAAVVAPSAVPAYAAVDRLMRMSLAVLAGIPSRLQSWLGSATANSLDQRRSRTIQLNCIIGVFCGVGFALLAPFVGQIVFAGSLTIVPELAWASGTLLGIICASRGAGLILVSAGGANSLTVAIVPSALTGLAMIVPLAVGVGPVGIVGAGICAELVGLTVQSFLYRRRLRH